MKPLTLLEAIATWTPEQQLAVHDFCQLMGDAIWQQHADRLIEHILQQDSSTRIEWPEPPSSDNLQLHFDRFL